MKFEVIQNGFRDDCVWLFAQDGSEVVLGQVTREALSDAAAVRDLNPQELTLIASANIDALSRVLTRKLDAGEAARPRPGDRLRVTLVSAELLASGERVSTTVLGSAFAWLPS